MGFAPTVARLVLLTAIMKGTQPRMYAGGSHVSPRGIIELDRDGVNPVSYTHLTLPTILRV